jgi:hypothetical protein
MGIHKVGGRSIMDTALLISLAGACCTVIGTILGYRNGLKKEGHNEGSLRSDIGYIKSSVDDLKTEQRNFNGLHYELAERVAKVETSDKSAHHRIDGIEEKINKIRGGSLS